MKEYRKIISKQITHRYDGIKYIQLDNEFGMLYCTRPVWTEELTPDTIINIESFLDNGEFEKLKSGLAPIMYGGKERTTFRTPIKGTEYFCLAYKCDKCYNENPAVGFYLLDENADNFYDEYAKCCEMQTELIYKSVLNILDIPVVFTTDSYINFANKAFADLLGLKQSVVHSTKLSKLAAKQYQPKLSAIENGEELAEGESFTAVFPTQMNTNVTTEVSSVPFLGDKNSTLNFFVDRTANDKMKRTAAIYSKIISGVDEAIVITDRSYNVIWFNESFGKNTGYGNNNFSLLIEKIHENPLDYGSVEEIINEIENTGSWRGVINFHRSDGTIFPAEVHIVRMGDYYVTKINDISKRTELEKLIVQNKKIDYLTGVYNAQFFMEKLQKSFDNHKAEGKRLCLMVFGVDSYEEIFQRVNCETANAVLQTIALRAKSYAGPDSYVARLGESRFGLMFEAENDEKTVEFIEGFMSAMDWPLVYKKHDFFIKISAGVGAYPDNAGSFSELYCFVRDNHRKARADKRSAYAIFTRSEGLQIISHQNSLELDLIHALKSDEFVVYFQPKVDIESGSVIEAEALVRWESPTYGTVTPASFIHLAEDTGMMIPLGYKIIELVCRHQRSWHEQGFAPIKTSINLTFNQLLDDNFMSKLDEILRENSVEADMLEFEISEADATVDYESVQLIIKALRRMGILVCIDNFGTGTTSIPQLAEIPIERLTIDRSMLKDIETDINSRMRVERIIALAKQLGVKTIAEGVETENQLAILRELGCNYYQGYYFSKPVPAGEFTQFLKGVNKA